MNLSKISKSLLIALPMIALGACSSNSATETESAEQTNAPATTQAETTTTANDTVQTDAIEAIELTEEEKLIEQYSSAILETTIQFEFDKSTILPEFALILDAHAKFLIDNASKSVTVEGHADEKGTPEYNIALGERRAIAVSNYLQNMGVAESQIKVVSYGEEKPANFAHNEAAWAENRRAVLVY
ncbi:peptidoglycan-associated lipoprotein Pal [Psychromonas algicola]|uniref:peptidoglycan-associated lipoprotein Pal n=1 Tax=Psychromonas algicola TaxID=2555642 RepID=UPI001067E189|nr:peptidoglycan-associated lipoprotein Pal [Psychromonas sp. RZ5]TEW45988.1 peptidoglycan-associated lipoprotein Pal [Psychromonas sp. RZ5]